MLPTPCLIDCNSTGTQTLMTKWFRLVCIYAEEAVQTDMYAADCNFGELPQAIDFKGTGKHHHHTGKHWMEDCYSKSAATH